jgi:1,4-alpha-glucan branching enzyme
MKKLYSFLFGLMAVTFASAQVNVTFSVDMSNETVAAEGIHIAGDFQGWNSSGTPLSDQGGGIYAVTLSLAAGAYEFKFINGNDWPQEELVPDACRANLSGNTNRRIEVGMMDATYAVCFSNCAACGDYAVLFRVDMSLQAEIAPQGVHVAGEFNGWDAGANELFDADGDGVYTGLYSFDPAVLDNGNLIFKYINGDSF